MCFQRMCTFASENLMVKRLRGKIVLSWSCRDQRACPVTIQPEIFEYKNLKLFYMTHFEDYISEKNAS